jgi:hypothetical protein
MNYYDKVVSYIRKTIPTYTYTIYDFTVINDGNGPYIVSWNSSLSVLQPTEEQLNAITQAEYDSSLKKKTIISQIPMFDSIDDILNPQKGSSAYINGYLKVYNNGIWTIDQEISDIQRKEVVDVGSGDISITVTNLLSGIIEGEPNGNRTWTLPTSADIISNTPNSFVGKTLNITFSNNSETKKITLSLGSGNITKIKKLQILSDSSITLMFRFDNITSGQELISIFKI